MTCSGGCWRRRLAGLVLATSWLGGCATAGSEPAVVAVCPPVVEYSSEVRARAAEELALLPEGSAVVEMLGDYAVMREQRGNVWGDDMEYLSPAQFEDGSARNAVRNAIRHRRA